MQSDSLTQFYQQYYKELYLYIFSMCKNVGRTEDLLQETFLKALLSLPDSNANVRAWLYIVARNLYFDKLKEDKHFVTDQNMEFLKDDSSKDPLENILTDELNRALYLALSNLEPRKREVLELQYFGGLSQKEIAKILNLKPNYIRVLALRARQEIRLWMEEHGYDLP